MPMKRVYLGILLILSLLASTPLKAENVGRDRALEAARTFFQYDRARSPRRVVLHELPFAPQTKAAADPAFYVFEREGGGFVIVAGDDRCRPVLGYSFTRPFVDPSAMPESLRELPGTSGSDQERRPSRNACSDAGLGFLGNADQGGDGRL